jgi:protein-S-isoprenylcysteine O-methyltransferase Ste14
MSASGRSAASARLIGAAGGLLFVGALLYFAVCYVWRFDRPPVPDASRSVAIALDTLLFTVFALHHSVFARTGLKALVRAAVPPPLERSTYVWVASLLFVATCAWWQPVAGGLWRASGLAAVALRLLQLAAAGFTLVAARSIGVMELAGVAQVWPRFASTAAPALDHRGPYGLVRHPIYLAWLVLVWAAPTMNGTRVLFAALSTIYLVIAVPFEERDLARHFGAAYEAYRRQVRWRMIPGLY